MMRNLTLKIVTPRTRRPLDTCKIEFSSSKSENGDKYGSVENAAPHEKGPIRRDTPSPPSTSWTYYGESMNYLKNYMNSIFSSAVNQPLSVGVKSLPKKLKIEVAAPKLKHLHSVISREALRSRTEALVDKLKSANSAASRLLRVRELAQHLLVYPECSCVAWQRRAVPLLLKLRQKTRDRALNDQISQCFALLGVIDPVPARGVRLLSIDGGGTRGLMALEILDALQEMCPERKIHTLFDYIVGVSTGALIAALLGGLHADIAQCKKIYREASVKLFDQRRLAGSLGLIRHHSYYDTNQWTTILRNLFNEVGLMETANSLRNDVCPKLGIVSCTAQPRLEPFIFRNYYYHPDSQSTYLGSGAFKLWEALRASAAAPGYFAEVKLGPYIHQDGGVLANNPTGMGLHECRILWPDTPLHCVLSIGNGRAARLPAGPGPPPPGQGPQFSSAVEKLYHAVASATDTEKVG